MKAVLLARNARCTSWFCPWTSICSNTHKSTTTSQDASAWLSAAERPVLKQDPALCRVLHDGCNTEHPSPPLQANQPRTPRHASMLQIHDSPPDMQRTCSVPTTSLKLLPCSSKASCWSLLNTCRQARHSTARYSRPQQPACTCVRHFISHTNSWRAGRSCMQCQRGKECGPASSVDEACAHT